jgi:hypothetical protein
VNKPLTIWEGDQKSLFRKYGERRKKAMEDICGRLDDLKEDFGS